VYIGLAVSAFLHLALIAWALVHIQSTPEHKPATPEPVAVSIVTPDELTRLRQGDRNAKQLDAEAKESPKPDPPKKEAPKPKVAAAPPPAAEPPPPEPEAKPPEPAEPKKDPIADKLAALPKEPEPAPGPTPDEQKALEAKLEAERKAEEQRKAAEAKKKADDAKKKADDLKRKLEQQKKLAEAKKKADEAKKKQFDADNISALLNKIPDKGGPAPAVEKSDLPTKVKGPVAGAPEGKDSRLTASEMALLVAAIRQGVQPCWRVLAGGQGAEATAVRMRIKFNQDGTLNGDPQILNSQGTAYFVAASESAKRAVIQCQPYQLPAEKYAAWQDVILNFDPKDMF